MSARQELTEISLPILLTLYIKVTKSIFHDATHGVSFVRGRHDELVSEGGVYADMWLQQQKAEEKEKHGSISDSVEEEKDDKYTEK